MKKLGKLLITLLLAVVSLTAVFAVTACTSKPSGTEYSIVFRDKDGEELKTVTVKKGVVPNIRTNFPRFPLIPRSLLIPGNGIKNSWRLPLMRPINLF